MLVLSYYPSIYKFDQIRKANYTIHHLQPLRNRNCSCFVVSLVSISSHIWTNLACIINFTISFLNLSRTFRNYLQFCSKRRNWKLLMMKPPPLSYLRPKSAPPSPAVVSGCSTTPPQHSSSYVASICLDVHYVSRFPVPGRASASLSSLIFAASPSLLISCASRSLFSLGLDVSRSFCFDRAPTKKLQNRLLF